MHTTVRLSVPQRKSFITLVKDAKVRQQAKLDSERYDWARNVRRDFIARNVPDEAKQIAKEITALREKVRRGEQQLDTLGFVLQYDGTFSLSNAAPASLERACDERVELHAAMRNSSLEKYDTVILELLTIESVEQAKGIVEKLLA